MPEDLTSRDGFNHLVQQHAAVSAPITDGVALEYFCSLSLERALASASYTKTTSLLEELTTVHLQLTVEYEFLSFYVFHDRCSL